MTTDPATLRVAYVPYSSDLSAPGDRRRFVRYAKLRGLHFDIISEPSDDYDLIILSYGADLSVWSHLPPWFRPKLIFELVDSYLEEPAGFRRAIRGPAKWLLGQQRRFEWSQREALIRMCRRADGVLCSTPEQRETLSTYNKDVFPILDFHDMEAVKTKSDYGRSRTFHLFWEGQAPNLVTFREIAAVLTEVAKDHDIVVHLATDPFVRFVNAPLPRPPTSLLFRHIVPGVRHYVYPWNATGTAAIARACDLGLIPMQHSSGIRWAKPENKLLLLWRLGLPTLTSPTPAYQRAMESAGIDMLCSDAREWRSKLALYMSDEAMRRTMAQRGRLHAETEHGTNALAARWDEALAAVVDGKPAPLRNTSRGNSRSTQNP